MTPACELLRHGGSGRAAYSVGQVETDGVCEVHVDLVHQVGRLAVLLQGTLLLALLTKAAQCVRRAPFSNNKPSPIIIIIIISSRTASLARSNACT